MKAIVDYSKGNYPDVDALMGNYIIDALRSKESIVEIKKAVSDGRVSSGD